METHGLQLRVGAFRPAFWVSKGAPHVRLAWKSHGRDSRSLSSLVWNPKSYARTVRDRFLLSESDSPRTSMALPSALISWPRIALITPVFNSVRYIEQTIRSVLAQGYPNLDYFVVDGGSTDGTLDVIRKYESQISGWISEPDNGMYDALNKGFARTSGEIMGWISATDQLHSGGLAVLGGVFREFPDVEWITGRPTWFNEEGMTIKVLDLQRWSRSRFLAGANRYIQQESTFWRRSLWEQAGGYADASRRMSSDLELWARFFRHAQIYPVDALIAGFRLHRDSLVLSNLEECHRIGDEIIDAELSRTRGFGVVKSLRRINRAIRRVPKVRVIWQRLILDNLYKLLYRVPGTDWPAVIEYQWGKNTWGYRK
jgi:glycosyltransferase involved in cell wall biosynthesis